MCCDVDCVVPGLDVEVEVVVLDPEGAWGGPPPDVVAGPPPTPPPLTLADGGLLFFESILYLATNEDSQGLDGLVAVSLSLYSLF